MAWARRTVAPRRRSPSLSVTLLILALVVAVVVLSGGGGRTEPEAGTAARRDDPPPTFEDGDVSGLGGERARAADSFVDSIGVATHLNYEDTPYRDRRSVGEHLAALGIRHIRDGWPPDADAPTRFMRDVLGPSGVEITFVHDPRDASEVEDLHALVRDELVEVTAAAESLNEWNNQGRSDWAEEARDWTERLAEVYRADGATADIPIVAPSLSDLNSEADHLALGDLSGIVDFGNVHDYPGKDLMMNEVILDTVFRNQRRVVGDLPIIATETGFSNGPEDAPYPVMPEEQVAVLLPRLYLEHFDAGIVRTFAYELFDEHDDDQFESGFGLVRHDGTPKPSYRAMQALIDLLDDPGEPFTPGRLPHRVEGAGPNTETLVLQKRDGTFWLAVWERVLVFDGSEVLDPPDRPVTVELDAPAMSVRTFTPTAGTTPQRTVGPTSSLAIESSADVLLVELAGVRSTDARPTGVEG